MDDFNISNLNESKNEWCARLVNILAPLVIEGFRSIFNEGYQLCVENDENDKYLMTYQNLISRIPKWNENMIEDEKTRIVNNSGCNYLEDLIACVHIVQLKVLTCIRVGQKQKSINIDVPNLNKFIHLVYIHCARKLYTSVYLYNKNLEPLDIQKNNNEIEKIIRENILNAIRESIPINDILRAYIDETYEEDIIEQSKEIVQTSTVGASGEEIETDTISSIETTLPKSFEETKLNNLSNKDVHIVKSNAMPVIVPEQAQAPAQAAQAQAAQAQAAQAQAAQAQAQAAQAAQAPAQAAQAQAQAAQAAQAPAQAVPTSMYVPAPSIPPSIPASLYNSQLPTVKEDKYIDNYDNNRLDVVDFAQKTPKNLRFDENDHSMSVDNREELISAPKNIDRLEQISEARNVQRKIDEQDEDDEDRIRISGDVNLELDNIELDIIDMNS
jgi:hypothetical protein